MNEKVKIHPTAEVSKDSVIGEDSSIWHYVQVREGAKIGSGCTLGKSSYVGKNVKIGNNVKIQNMCSLYQGVTIEDDAFIGPHVVFTNDMMPRSFNDDWDIVPILVKRGASIGANSTIICGVTIGEYAMVGAGSIVTKDVPDHALVYGSPARIKGFVCKCGRKLEKVREDDGFVVMTCLDCKQELKIPKRK